MIIYCGLRPFYIRHFNPPQADAYYILTHNREIWDCSPGLPIKTKAVLQLDRPVLTIPITLSDFASYAEDWHAFTLHYTDELEIEYPHSWYLRFKERAIFEQFITDYNDKMQRENEGGIWGAGQSKLVAKLAAHNCTGYDRIVPPGHTKSFLSQLPLHRLPLPELETLEKLGIKTIGELGNIPPMELSSQFGQKTADILHKLGNGEDLVSFHPHQTQEFRWSLDCITLDGFLRPLASHELKSYLQQGMEKLAATLKDQHKVAGQIKLEAHLAQGTYFEKTRQLKQATDDPKVIHRIAESLVPEDFFTQVDVVISKLEASPLAQLTMFWEPQAPRVMDDDLKNYAQVGVKVPRRERLLMLWEECFA